MTNVARRDALVALTCLVNNSACMWVLGFHSRIFFLWQASEFTGYNSLKLACFMLWWHLRLFSSATGTISSQMRRKGTAFLKVGTINTYFSGPNKRLWDFSSVCGCRFIRKCTQVTQGCNKNCQKYVALYISPTNMSKPCWWKTNWNTTPDPSTQHEHKLLLTHQLTPYPHSPDNWTVHHNCSVFT